MQPVPSTPFGRALDGREARLWRIANAHGMAAEITNMGACLVSLHVPDGCGNLLNVVLGHDGAEGYSQNPAYFGAVIGRCTNRIAGASFELSGERHELARNEGPNNIHSGPHMWLMRTWEVVEATSHRMVLSLASPDGDQGFPGAVEVRVAYELSDDDALSITYEGEPSAPTIMNLTSHSYFNLNGCSSGSAMDHTLQVRASSYTECDDANIPTGRILPVEDTPLDFREARPIAPSLASGFHSIEVALGIDHNYVLEGFEPDVDGFVGAGRRVATLTGERTGIALDVYTDAPGMQVYTANYIDGEHGRGGFVHHAHDAVCLETQFFPDAIHHPDFPQPVFGPNRPYRSRTVYAFRHE